MTLEEMLNNLNQNEDVYIGSKSAFIFMDTPEVFFNMRVEINDLWRRKFQSTVEKSTMTLENIKSNPPKEDDTSLREVWIAGHKSIKNFSYEDLLDEWKTRIERIEANLNNSKKQLEEFIPFEQREVIMSYRNIDNTATIIIIPGYESGKFWMKSEWIRYMNGEDVIVEESEEEDIESESEDEDIADNTITISAPNKHESKTSDNRKSKSTKDNQKPTIEEYNANCIWLRERKYVECKNCIQYGICKDLYKRYLKSRQMKSCRK